MNKSDFYYEGNLERQLKFLQQENANLKWALNEIKKLVSSVTNLEGCIDRTFCYLDKEKEYLLQIIDKVLGDEK